MRLEITDRVRFGQMSTWASNVVKKKLLCGAVADFLISWSLLQQTRNRLPETANGVRIGQLSPSRDVTVT